MRFWNVNGWLKVNTDNSNIRNKSVIFSDVDLLGIAETHLRDGDSLELPGYLWFGHNRKSQHVRAMRGSGGVSFFVKQTLLNEFVVNIINSSEDDIL